MRFNISCRDRDTEVPYLVEVIGEVVDIPGMPESSCAVHALVNMGATAPLYAVTHIESGKRVAGGDSIDFAIRLARETVADKDPAFVAKTLEAAVKQRREIDLAVGATA